MMSERNVWSEYKAWLLLLALQLYTVLCPLVAASQCGLNSLPILIG
jgi:hypothetical protein